RAALDARQQALDLQIVRANPLERRDGAHQHMVYALELARLFDRAHVLRLFDDADDVVVARVIAAEPARVLIGDVVANRAVGHALLDVAESARQHVDAFARRLQDVKGKTLRALRADAGQALQFFDES